jgi:hypothetical protein
MFISELWSIIITYLSTLDDVTQLIYVMAIKANREKCDFNALEIMRTYVFNVEPCIPKMLTLCRDARNITKRNHYMRVYKDSMDFQATIYNQDSFSKTRIYMTQIMDGIDDELLRKRLNVIFKYLLDKRTKEYIDMESYETLNKPPIILYPKELMAQL